MSGRLKLLLRLHIIYPFTAHFHRLRSLTFISTYHPYMLHTVNTNEESAKLGKKMATERDVQCNRKEIIVRSDYIHTTRQINFLYM